MNGGHFLTPFTSLPCIHREHGERSQHMSSDEVSSLLVALAQARRGCAWIATCSSRRRIHGHGGRRSRKWMASCLLALTNCLLWVQDKKWWHNSLFLFQTCCLCLWQIDYYESRTRNDDIFLSFCSKHAVLHVEHGERLVPVAIIISYYGEGRERKVVADCSRSIHYYEFYGSRRGPRMGMSLLRTIPVSMYDLIYSSIVDFRYSCT